jgi:hypothetical protein
VTRVENAVVRVVDLTGVMRIDGVDVVPVVVVVGVARTVVVDCPSGIGGVVLGVAEVCVVSGVLRNDTPS